MSLLIAMISFSLAMSISPGPVNMVIVSSGASYGIRKTFSFVSGATIGFTLLLLFIGLGFYKVMDLYPSFLEYLAISGSLFIIYMGYLMVSSKPELGNKVTILLNSEFRLKLFNQLMGSLLIVTACFLLYSQFS